MRIAVTGPLFGGNWLLSGLVIIEVAYGNIAGDFQGPPSNGKKQSQHNASGIDDMAHAIKFLSVVLAVFIQMLDSFS